MSEALTKNDKQDLLVEIGTEELPPKALKTLADSFTSEINSGLEQAALSFDELTQYATPRRLAVWVKNLQTAQQDKEVVRRGPALTAAFGEDGCPTPAAQGFARSCGVEPEALEKMETDQGAWLAFRSVEQGKATKDLLPDIVLQALHKLPIPKRMRWGDLSAEFVRPVHWVVFLFGNEVVDTQILAVRTGRETRGHRFHHPGMLYLGEPAAYGPLLETEGHVIADFNDRREAVRAQILEAAAKISGTAIIDEALLDEVTSMVEWPIAVLGNFEPRFLEVPSEALISAMKSHQKYFHLVDNDGKLLPHFITVSNIESRDPKQVRAGNERVIRPRLADADFFWNQDRKKKLIDRLPGLTDVVFQNKLGSLHDKAERVAGLAYHIADKLRANKQMAERAAMLAKCDLLTDMVGEFPELQGIMGRYYALHDGEPGEIAQAIDEHYMPRFAGDALPASPIGCCVSIADKLDTLVGIFGIGQIPTGDKDPFALRRLALGVLRIIIEQKLDLDLQELLEKAKEIYSSKVIAKDVVPKVYDFMMERLRAYYHEAGIRPDVFEAVLVQRPTQPYDFDRRLYAVTEFRKLPEAESLATANKRTSNIIIKQAKGKIADQADPALLQEKAEQELAKQVEKYAQLVKPLYDQRDYEGALKQLARLREPVDTFFDNVMVMVDDTKLRDNRLALLNSMRQLFLRVADLSRLQG